MDCIRSHWDTRGECESDKVWPITSNLSYLSSYRLQITCALRVSPIGIFDLARGNHPPEVLHQNESIFSLFATLHLCSTSQSRKRSNRSEKALEQGLFTAECMFSKTPLERRSLLLSCRIILPKVFFFTLEQCRMMSMLERCDFGDV